MVTVVDEDVNIYDLIDVEWAVATRHDPERGMIFIRDTVGHELNPMVQDGIVTKVGIDATAPTPRPWKFQRAHLQKVDLGRYKIE